MIYKKKLFASCFLLPLVFSAQSAVAAIVSAPGGASTAGLDLAEYKLFTGSGGSSSDTSEDGFGNTYTYDNLTPADSANLEVTGFSALRENSAGLPTNPLLTPSELNIDHLGIGVCNQIEGEGCNAGSTPNVDNNFSFDFILFTFDTDVVFSSSWFIGLDPAASKVDLSYWIGDLSNLNGGDLSEFDVTTVEFIDATTVNSGSGLASSIDYGNAQGDALLIGAQYFAESGGLGDSFRLDGLDVYVVPVPAAVWFFGSALAGLFCARRKLNR